MENLEARKILDSTMEDIALVVGGIFAVHAVQDEVVWKVMKHLDISHNMAVARLEQTQPVRKRDDSEDRESSQTHPAVEALLMKLRVKRDD